MNNNPALLASFIRRELRNRYLGSLSGGLWALLQPLAQLAIYGFVWTCVFKMRVPDDSGGNVGIVPFLALGVWPWNAFNEGIVRATTAIQDNAALIGKVAVPRWMLVFACTAAAFMLHGLGFLAIGLLFALSGTALVAIHIPLALLVFVQLFGLALGFAFLFSAIQVFVRDLAQVLAQIMPLWMFVSPVLYARDFLPPAYRAWFDLNPFTFYPECLRALLLGQGETGPGAVTVAFAAMAMLLAVGYAVFRRLQSRFEDFL